MAGRWVETLHCPPSTRKRLGDATAANHCLQRSGSHAAEGTSNVNLPDALKNIAGAVEALNDAINKAKADPNLGDIEKDLVMARPRTWRRPLTTSHEP